MEQNLKKTKIHKSTNEIEWERELKFTTTTHNKQQIVRHHDSAINNK